METKTIEHIHILLGLDVAEKERMMMDAIKNKFDEGTIRQRIEFYQRAYDAREDFEAWREEQLEEVDDG